jgi:hypothetical protein
MEIHTSKNCNSPFGITSFTTDRMCFSSGLLNPPFGTKLKKGNSSLTFFNHELKQAELISFDASGCTGNVTKKEVYPVGKCIPVGPDGTTWITVKK